MHTMTRLPCGAAIAILMACANPTTAAPTPIASPPHSGVAAASAISSDNDTTAMISELRQRIAAPQVSVTTDVNAPSRDVYRLIADYRFGHSRILPPDFFRNLEVEKGGYGAGTVIQFDMLAFGRTQHLWAHVTEPDPGRVLTEAYPQNGAVTAFTVDSLGFDRSRVTIATYLRVGTGIRGRLELWMMRRFLRKVYIAELALIDQQVQSDRAN